LSKFLKIKINLFSHLNKNAKKNTKRKKNASSVKFPFGAGRGKIFSSKLNASQKNASKKMQIGKKRKLPSKKSKLHFFPSKKTQRVESNWSSRKTACSARSSNWVNMAQVT
jgi:sugar diacid utilization regulator